MDNLCKLFIKNKIYEYEVEVLSETLSNINPIIRNFSQFTSECTDQHIINKVYYSGYHMNVDCSIINCYTANNSLLFVTETEPLIEYHNGIPKIYCYEILVSVGKYVGYFKTFINPITGQVTKYKDLSASGIGVIGIDYSNQLVVDTLSNHYANNREALEFDVFAKPSKYPEILNNNTGIDYVEYEFDTAFFRTDPSILGFNKASHLYTMMHRTVSYNQIKKESIIHVVKKIITENPTVKQLNECFQSNIINKNYHRHTNESSSQTPPRAIFI